MKLYLVSNGRTMLDNQGLLSGQNSAILSSIGMLEVFQLKNRLKDISFSQIYVSPQKSALETAKVLKRKDQDYLIVDNLKNIDFAEFEGENIDAIINDSKHPIHDLFAKPQSFEIEGGENFKDLQNRCLNFYQNQIYDKRHSNENIMVVTHSIWIKNFICALFNFNENYIWLIQKSEGCNAYLFEYENDQLILKGLQL